MILGLPFGYRGMSYKEPKTNLESQSPAPCQPVPPKHKHQPPQHYNHNPSRNQAPLKILWALNALNPSSNPGVVSLQFTADAPDPRQAENGKLAGFENGLLHILTGICGLEAMGLGVLPDILAI